MLRFELIEKCFNSTHTYYVLWTTFCNKMKIKKGEVKNSGLNSGLEPDIFLLIWLNFWSEKEILLTNHHVWHLIVYFKISKTTSKKSEFCYSHFSDALNSTNKHHEN